MSRISVCSFGAWVFDSATTARGELAVFCKGIRDNKVYVLNREFDNGDVVCCTLHVQKGASVLFGTNHKHRSLSEI